MRVSTRSWLGLMVIAMAAASLGLLIRNADSQEEHGHAKPILLKVEASDDNPFGTQKSHEREKREHAQPEKREHGERPTERDILKQQIEVFKIALHGLMEAEKKDAAEVLQRAIRAREVTLEGRRDDEAHMIREHAPSRGQLAEILMLASKLWREFHNQDKAEVVGRLAREFAGEGKREPARAHRGPQGERDELRGRLHELEQALVHAREAGKEDEAARIRRQMQEIAQHMEGGLAHRPPAPRGQEEVERLKGAVRELNGQVNEMRREMAEMRRLLEKLVEQKHEDR